jgi:nucleoside-diphosphate-sugar epimerase
VTLIAVTGATGFVGQSLLDVAQSMGVGVRALARRVPDPREGVTWVQGDLHDRAALARLVAGTEAVIHVAGVVNAADPADFDTANVDGTAAVLDAARAAGVPRFVFVSSLSAREPDLSRYGASKARAELHVRASGLDWTTVRPPTIYGPRDTDNFELFRAARWGVVPVPAGGRASMIHAEDLARLLLALIPGGESVTGQTFEPDDGVVQGWAHEDMARAVGAAVGRKPMVIGLPPFALRLGARIDAMLRGDKAKLTMDRVGYMTHPDWVVRHRPPLDLWQARIETRAGLAATAEWYRAAGWF